jgi:hypothetical protein
VRSLKLMPRFDLDHHAFKRLPINIASVSSGAPGCLRCETTGRLRMSGIVISVRGAVVDVAFDDQALPPIDSALLVDWDRGEPLKSHVDSLTVRAIALQSTTGLARGANVRATRAPIMVPVGDAVLGRLLDVVGAIRDRGPPLAPDTPSARNGLVLDDAPIVMPLAVLVANLVAQKTWWRGIVHRSKREKIPLVGTTAAFARFRRPD